MRAKVAGAKWFCPDEVQQRQLAADDAKWPKGQGQ
jgi:hypothetical protein